MESGVVPIEIAEKSDILKQLSQRPPRLGGFTRFSALESWAEFSDERNFGRIRQYLLEPDPAPVEDTSTKPIASKHFLKGLFRSHSDRKSSRNPKKTLKMQSLQEECKLPVVARRTSYGGKYGQIVTNQVYDVNKNASAYQINVAREASTGKRTRKPTEPVTDKASNTATSSLHKVTGFRRPTDGATIQQAGEHQPPAGTSSACQIADLQESKLERLATKPYRCPDKDPPQGSSMSNVSKPLIDVPLQPVHHANESFVISRKEYPHLLLRDDKRPRTPRASRISIARSESQPTIRDFAPNGPTHVQRAKAACVRSRSPAKKITKQISAASSIVDIPGFPTYDGQSLGFEISTFPNTDSMNPNSGAKMQAPPSTPILHRPIPSLQPSPLAAFPPRAPSVTSAESLAEDLQSNTSSVIVSDAQLATMIHNQGAAIMNYGTSTPPQPGPAPTKALPSLPEGQTPMTPSRLSESSYRMPASPEYVSPASPTKLPERSPARYRFTPMKGGSPSPPRRMQEPVCINAVADTEQLMARPVNETGETEKTHPLPFRENKTRQDIAPTRSEGWPESLSTGDIDRFVEKAKATKAMDLARVKNTKAEVDDVNVSRIEMNVEAAIDSGNEEQTMRNKELILLPSPPSLDKCAQTTIIRPVHPHPSPFSIRSPSTTLQGDNSTLSQRLSPIVVLAEQEPVAVQRAASKNPQASHAEYRRPSVSKRANGLQPHPSKPLSPALYFPDDDPASKNRAQRPLSAHSMPLPNNRPVMNPEPTPLSPSLLHHRLPSTRSSSHEDVHNVPVSMSIADAVTGLEARIEAVERKNCMLERAFLAVLDARAGYPSARAEIGGLNLGSEGRLSEHRRSSGTDSLSAGLESLVAVHSGEMGAPVMAGAYGAGGV